MLVLESDGTTFTEESAACDGSDSAVVAALSCTIPLATLRTAPYSLTLGELVRVKVRAINGQGPGPFSQVNAAGGLVETVPAAVTGLTHDTASSTVSTNSITWPELTGNTATGRSAITGYEVDQAESSATPTWATLATVSPGVGAY